MDWKNGYTIFNIIHKDMIVNSTLCMLVFVTNKKFYEYIHLLITLCYNQIAFVSFSFHLSNPAKSSNYQFFKILLTQLWNLLNSNTVNPEFICNSNWTYYKKWQERSSQHNKWNLLKLRKESELVFWTI